MGTARTVDAAASGTVGQTPLQVRTRRLETPPSATLGAACTAQALPRPVPPFVGRRPGPGHGGSDAAATGTTTAGGSRTAGVADFAAERWAHPCRWKWQPPTPPPLSIARCQSPVALALGKPLRPARSRCCGEVPLFGMVPPFRRGSAVAAPFRRCRTVRCSGEVSLFRHGSAVPGVVPAGFPRRGRRVVLPLATWRVRCGSAVLGVAGAVVPGAVSAGGVGSWKPRVWQSPAAPGVAADGAAVTGPGVCGVVLRCGEGSSGGGLGLRWALPLLVPVCAGSPGGLRR
ncbi:hypothetical protein SAMN05216174_108175 [Actinokineospora iranica]|uniref:Uncharacterized protein n=1 Tax=Actinokineospora iranica TaxID=1271860 RepID=A0A1G6SUE6_9PSEU|nr:hypothetical protein SAMN05216174_108175 [Actinokineospora iranica]